MPADTDRPSLRIPIVGAISMLGMLAAIAIGGWAIAIATEGAHRQANEADFSSLWLVPVGPARTSQPVSVGITNHEGQASTYQLTVRQGTRTLRQWQLPLEDGASWEAYLPGSALPGSGPVIAQLDRDGIHEHQVTLRLGGSG
jgi:hypothetical protein